MQLFEETIDNPQFAFGALGVCSCWRLCADHPPFVFIQCLSWSPWYASRSSSGSSAPEALTRVKASTGESCYCQLGSSQRTCVACAKYGMIDLSKVYLLALFLFLLPLALVSCCSSCHLPLFLFAPLATCLCFFLLLLRHPPLFQTETSPSHIPVASKPLPADESSRTWVIAEYLRRFSISHKVNCNCVHFCYYWL